MRLLIVTQTVDSQHPVLGFFVEWIRALAPDIDAIEVICLTKGKYALPANVVVHSLGKEKRSVSRGRYAARFLRLVWKLRGNYDAVFVHMNQEYVLLAGWLWRALGKRVYLWRNHYAGSRLTDSAALFCTKVFCTSQHSYTARYRRTVLMPVGVDTTRFYADAGTLRVPHSILFLGRMAKSKRPAMLIDALAALAREHVVYTATLVGSPGPDDEAYYEALQENVRSRGLQRTVTFLPAMPNDRTPDLYRAHEIFVNTSPSGMLDKTIFEAAACDCRVLAASADFAELAGADSSFDSVETLIDRLRNTLAYRTHADTNRIVAQHSLSALVERILTELK